MSPLSITLLKTWSRLTRWLLAAVLLFWLLFGAAWGTLHWLIVPRIGEFRPQMEAWASQALGVPVRVGAVTAKSNGMMPSFELVDVALYDAQGRVALSLPRVLVAMSPRSLWRLGFEQIYIDRPQLDIRRAADGRISIGGLDFSAQGDANTQALDWFFSQSEFAIHDGTVRWRDELRAAEPLQLQQVQVVVRNKGRHHDLRLDATPPPAWGERFSARGQFVQPLLARQKGRWQDWQGQVYAAFERIDLSALRHYADLGVDLTQGRGAVRAWFDVSQGRLTAATSDVALAEVAVVLKPDLPTLDLQQVQGRLGGRRLGGGFEFFTQALVFDTPDGVHWPGGNMRLLTQQAQGTMAEGGTVEIDRLDLAALASLAPRLPLDAALGERLASYAPQGQVLALKASWQGTLAVPLTYSATGQVQQLTLAAVGQMPGVRGLNVDFNLNQQGGRASLSMSNGSVDAPTFFLDSLIPVDQLSAQASWQLKGADVTLAFDKVTFSNADAQGEAQIKWQTADPAKALSRNRLPGALDLQATLSRADGRRVYRYLPLVIDPVARDYVRDAVLEGTASNVRFAIKGDIDQLPGIDAKKGVFKISADVSHAKLAYVPTRLQESQELPWPVLTDLNGTLLIDGLRLQVKDARARLGENTALQVNLVNANIDNLMKTQVQVDAQFNGPLPDALQLVNRSPVAPLTGNALARAVATGNADYTLKLMLHVAEMDKSTVQGTVTLTGNDVQVTPDSPKLVRAKGVLDYSQSGLSLSGVQARALGGEARLDGGLSFVSNGARAGSPVIRISGNATAEALRQATELGPLARLARHFNGSTSYNAVLGWRAGATELLVTSTLQGMGSTLPAPLQKEAASRLPLRFETSVLPGAANANGGVVVAAQDRWHLALENVAQVVFERDTTLEQPRVLRGSISVGADTLGSLTLPDQGVNANINLPKLNADAWSDVLTLVSGSTVQERLSGQAQLGYLPSTVALRADALTFGGRTFNHLVLGADREGALWRANVQASELNGYLEYRQATDATTAASAGRVYARLARLTLAPNTASEVEALLDAQPASIPALDVVVDDFELRGKQLGRLEVEAINRAVEASGAREWRLNKLNLLVPEASFKASGNWTRVNAQTAPPSDKAVVPGAALERRRTVMNFKLDIADGGQLLSRFGMKDVVRQASGKMEGQVAWLGSPLKPDYPTLGGAFTVNVASGQFLKADPGLAKLLGVLSLQALPRRLTLDFRDVFSDGFAFDFLRGDVTVNQGIARTNNLQMKGVNAAVLMDGQANIADETQDLKVVVVPEINAGTASLIATVINPAVGLGTFLAQLFLRRPLIASNTQEFHIDGSWADPRVTKIVANPAPAKESTP